MSKSILLIFILSFTVASQPDAGGDFLIWTFPGGLTSPGIGYQNYDGLYGSDAGVYATAVEHLPGDPAGDRIVIRKSPDNGENWTLSAFTTTGAGNTAYTPRVVFCNDGQQILVFVLLRTAFNTSVVTCYKYSASTLSYISFADVDKSYPGMGPIRSFTVNPGCGGYYHVIMETDANNLFVSSSSNNGATWSPAAQLASNARRVSATRGPGNSVTAVWYDIDQQAVMCALGNESGYGAPVVVAAAPSNASPIPVWEAGSGGTIGVFWHSSDNMVMLSVSQNEAASWSVPEAIAPGLFPFADIFPGSSRVVVSHITAAGTVYSGTALNLSQTASIEFEQRNDHTAFTEHPAVVRYGSLAAIQGLFYIDSTMENLWFDNSLLTGIEGGGLPQEPAEEPISVVPNPSRGPALINVFDSGAVITVYSIDGRIVWQGVAEDGTVLLNEDLPAGVYTVSATMGNSLATTRMLRL